MSDALSSKCRENPKTRDLDCQITTKKDRAIEKLTTPRDQSGAEGYLFEVVRPVPGREALKHIQLSFSFVGNSPGEKFAKACTTHLCPHITNCSTLVVHQTRSNGKRIAKKVVEHQDAPDP